MSATIRSRKDLFTNKAQPKTQVEDLELAIRAATKAKQAAEAEAAEATAALEESTRARNDAAERAVTATRDAAAARAQLDDAEEEAAEVSTAVIFLQETYVSLKTLACTCLI